MAGDSLVMLANSAAVVEFAEAAAAAVKARAEWEAEYSRFFNFPKNRPSGRLRPLPRGRLAAGGTWISAAYKALIVLEKSKPESSFMLSVSVHSALYEEHLLSNLTFTWPHVSCISQCSFGGSRVIFVTFRDYTGQIGKFALRFATCDDAEAFLNSVKECCRDMIDPLPIGSDIACENSIISELTASEGPYCRHDRKTSDEPLAHDCEIPALTYHDEQSNSPLKPSLANNNVESIFSGFPPSFAELMTNFSKEPGNEQSTEKGKSRIETPMVENLSDSSSEANALEQAMMTNESILKSQILKYMSDASFHEMLFKIEKVMDELGSDMAL